jgi:hypothetical protein
MPATNTFPLVDRILDGRLTQRLTEWRAEGLSFTAIALRLHDDHGIDVTHETVRRWLKGIEAEVGGPAVTEPPSVPDHA